VSSTVHLRKELKLHKFIITTFKHQSFLKILLQGIIACYV